MPGPVICQSNVFSKDDCALAEKAKSVSKNAVNVFNGKVLNFDCKDLEGF